MGGVTRETCSREGLTARGRRFKRIIPGVFLFVGVCLLGGFFFFVGCVVFFLCVFVVFFGVVVRKDDRRKRKRGRGGRFISPSKKRLSPSLCRKVTFVTH